MMLAYPSNLDVVCPGCLAQENVPCGGSASHVTICPVRDDMAHVLWLARHALRTAQERGYAAALRCHRGSVALYTPTGGIGFRVSGTLRWAVAVYRNQNTRDTRISERYQTRIHYIPGGPASITDPGVADKVASAFDAWVSADDLCRVSQAMAATTHWDGAVTDLDRQVAVQHVCSVRLDGAAGEQFPGPDGRHTIAGCTEPYPLAWPYQPLADAYAGDLSALWPYLG